jgi:hypothetical protein
MREAFKVPELSMNAGKRHLPYAVYIWRKANGTAPCHHGELNGQRREEKKSIVLIVERIGEAIASVPHVEELLAPRECDRLFHLKPHKKYCWLCEGMDYVGRRI